MSDRNVDSGQWEERLRAAGRSARMSAMPSDAVAAALLERAEVAELPPEIESQAQDALNAALLDRRLSRAAAAVGSAENAASFGKYVDAVAGAARVSWSEWAKRLGVSARALEAVVRSDIAALRLPPRVIAEILDALDLPVTAAGRMLSAAVRELSLPVDAGAHSAAASIPMADLTPSLASLLDATAECLRERDRDDLAGTQ